MNVIALRQLAVFMNAGSYVMRPKSSEPVRICRRSIARTAPSVIGSSYVFPVRLSVTVSVSGIVVRLCKSQTEKRRGNGGQMGPALRSDRSRAGARQDLRPLLQGRGNCP